MKKSIIFAFFAVLLTVVVGLAGCGVVSSVTTSTDGTVTARLTSPEAVVSGTVTKSGDSFTVKINSIIAGSGFTREAITGLDASRFKIFVGTEETVGISYIPVATRIASTTSSKIDMVFILDRTGSMGSQITGAKNSIVAFASSLEAAGADVKFGLVAFGDVSNEAELALPATAAQMEAKLATIFASGGSDAPENPLDAVNYAYDSFTWRSDSQKVFIVITDVSAHQNVPEDNSADNLSVTSHASMEAKLSGNATVYVVGPKLESGSAPDTYGQAGTADVRWLADGYGWFSGVTSSTYGTIRPHVGTGGKWLELPSDGSMDLTEFGIASTVTSGYTLSFDYVSTGTMLYVYVLVDTNGDGVWDSDGLITFTISTSSVSKWLPNGQLADPALGVKGSSNN